MFIDDDTNVSINAELDTTICENGSNCEVILALLEVLSDTMEYVQYCQYHAIQFIFDPTTDENDERWKDLDDVSEELIDTCKMYSPEGYTFGLKENLFGFWKN